MKYFLPRLRAAGLHSLISVIVVVGVAAGAVSFWYPGNLAWAAGLAGLVSILVVVDVVLGPALTFLVYQPGKKSLRFDLSVIAAIQIAALVFGISSIYEARPVYLAFVVDRFETVAAADLEESMLKEAAEPYRSIPVNGPQVVGVEMPTDPVELENLTLAEAVNGTGPQLIPRYYREYETVVQSALSRSKDLAALSQFNPPEKVAKEISGISVSDSESQSADLRYMPLAGRDRDLTVIINGKTGAIVEIVDLRPWDS